MVPLSHILCCTSAEKQYFPLVSLQSVLGFFYFLKAASDSCGHPRKFTLSSFMRKEEKDHERLIKAGIRSWKPFYAPDLHIYMCGTAALNKVFNLETPQMKQQVVGLKHGGILLMLCS